MKHIYLALFCILSGSLLAQNVESNYPILNFTPDELVFDYGDIIITNNDAQSYDLKLRQEIIDAPDGATMAICFGITCYPPNGTDGYIYPNGFTLPGNGQDENFKVTYSNNSSNANAQWRLVLFDENTNEDIYTFEVWFDGPLGITEVYLSQSELGLPQPNPVIGESAINYQLPVGIDQAKLTVHNLTGAMVQEIALIENKGIVRLNSADFEKGVYFYTLNVDGNVLHTKRLIIAQ
ncbi:MAG: T9SS type A sorting domain-containing protein [Bacteroidota bacterium]